jgi:Mn2+/Fe2+ NRAMP family transporter
LERAWEAVPTPLRRRRDLTDEDQARSRDRARVIDARQRRRFLRLAWLLIGPGILVMLGENDGPSMLSYATSGATYGIGFFVPFIVVTFMAAMVVQEMSMRVAAVTHRGYGELIFQRYGHFWGWFTTGDLIFTNLVTLVAEFVAIRVGMGFFGIAPPVAVAFGLALVVLSVAGGRYWRWERMALGLAIFNLLFVAVAVMSHPSAGSIGKALLTWGPLPRGSLVIFLLLVASDIGATVTPWMLFFQQSAEVDKGITPKDIPQGRLDVILGGLLAALAGCGALVVAAVLFQHPGTSSLLARADFAGALRPVLGYPVAALFSLGLVEAGALAVMTISASSAYAIGETMAGAHSFNRRISDAPVFYGINIGLTVLAGLIVLIPGAPLLAIALNANLLATVLLPAALVFLLMLANDRELMGSRANGAAANLAATGVVAMVALAGSAYAVVGFINTFTGRGG